MIDRVSPTRVFCGAALFLLMSQACAPAWSAEQGKRTAPSLEPWAEAEDSDLMAGPSMDPMDDKEEMALGPEQTLREGKPAAAPKSVRSQPIPTGFVILEGKYIPPPYTIEWTEKGVRINDIAISMANDRWPYGNPFLPPGPDLAGRSGQSRARSHRQRQRSPWRIVAHLEYQLRANGMILSLDHEPAVFVQPREAVQIVDALTSGDSNKAKVEALVKVGAVGASSGQWAELLKTCHPTSELRERVSKLKEDLKAAAVDAIGPAHSGAFTSLMTSLSIALTVLAFGTLLNHRPDRRGWSGWNPSRSGCRLVFRCVLLIVVLNLFDLACTVLAARAGGFWELNPVAERLVENVATMVAFKVSLIFAGAAILLFFRRYRFTQHAAWWVCIFHMVLMLRWATYNSMFLT